MTSDVITKTEVVNSSTGWSVSAQAAGELKCCDHYHQESGHCNTGAGELHGGLSRHYSALDREPHAA